MRKFYFALLLSGLSLSGLMGAAKAENNAALIEPVKQAISAYIQPNFERFSQETALLHEAVDSLCMTPSAAELKSVRDEFQNALKAFGRIEFIRLGVFAENNNAEKFLFWPDRQGIALKQVQKILHQEDQSVLDEASLEQKSVALQGFGTLEYILFGKGSEVLAEQKQGLKQGFRCAFAASLTGAMYARADTISKAWHDEAGFASIWSKPDAQNPKFRNNIEALNALVGTIAQALEIIRDTRLKPILGHGKKGVNHKRALLWRSDASFRLIKADIEGLLDLWRLSQLDRLLDEENKWLGGSVSFEFANAIKTLGEMEDGVQDIKNNVAKLGQLKYLMIVTRSLQEMIGEQYAAQVGLPSTFSSLDGD